MRRLNTLFLLIGLLLASLGATACETQQLETSATTALAGLDAAIGALPADAPQAAACQALRQDLATFKESLPQARTPAEKAQLFIAFSVLVTRFANLGLPADGPAQQHLRRAEAALKSMARKLGCLLSEYRARQKIPLAPALAQAETTLATFATS